MAHIDIPLVSNGRLLLSDAAEDRQSHILVGSDTWYTWLTDEQNRSFSFRTSLDTITARRERQRNGWYWYAYSKLSFNSYLVLLSVLFGLLCSIASFILSFPSFFSLVAGVSAGGLIFTCIVLYERWNQKVYIYTEGLIYLRQRKAEALRWEQIETIRYAKTELVTDDSDWDYLRIRKTNWRELEIWVKGLSGSSEILTAIEREFVRIRLPGMIEQYEAGHSIAFGALSVNKLGLTYQGETLAWSQVQSIDVGDQRVEIKKEGQKWGNWFNDRVPNQSLLRELVTHMRSSH